MNNKYDAIIVGAGHAGSEAANILCRQNFKTLLITIDKNKIASLPCNPAMGGPAKGILIKEVDALGGLIGVCSDMNCIQKRVLNESKGPAVWALRMQIDKMEYPKNMLKLLSKNKNLDIIEGVVDDLIIDNNKVCGVVLENNDKYYSRGVVITTGTYLKSHILIGSEVQNFGPDGDKTNHNLSNNLKKYGFEITRLKTGTPPRIISKTIDFTKSVMQESDNKNLFFSYDNKNLKDDNFKPVNCYITKTTLNTKDVIVSNISKSPIYSGKIEGVGPRYCPSIEDKIMRFKEKDMHQIFLEPEDKEFSLTYPQGLSSSMPRDVQKKFVRSIPGFENAKIKRYGYAIEYDGINPIELKASLETKKIDNLFCAGQINGTSGYEEAAAQGIIAGINLGLKLKNKEPLILKRYESYIGVLIDDLITKGAKEPYRMLTSRAEYRLILRDDNAIFRLRPYAIRYNLIDKKKENEFLKVLDNIKSAKEYFKNTYLYPNKINNILQDSNLSRLNNKISLEEFIKRPEINLENIKKIINLDYSDEVLNEVLIDLKYDGYIKKEEEQISKMKALENLYLGVNFDYKKVKNLAFEAREKLEKIKPETLGQASRILGVNPSDISILMIYLKAIKGVIKNDWRI